MSIKQPVLSDIMDLAAVLTAEERAQLVQSLIAMGEEAQATPGPRRSLFGILAGCEVSEEDIDAARKEIWHTFPREDIG